MTIYTVMGTTGEYSDRSEWPVVAYTDKSRAEEHVVKATQHVENHIATCKKYYHGIGCQDTITSPLDPSASADSNGTRYFLYDVELVEAK